jgi:hypothetical protein
MERAAGERWDGLTEAAEDVIQRQQGAAAELATRFDVAGRGPRSLQEAGGGPRRRAASAASTRR